MSGNLTGITKRAFTHVDFTQDDINNAANDDNEVKDIPGVSKVALHIEAKLLLPRL